MFKNYRNFLKVCDISNVKTTILKSIRFLFVHGFIIIRSGVVLQVVPHVVNLRTLITISKVRNSIVSFRMTWEAYNIWWSESDNTHVEEQSDRVMMFSETLSRKGTCFISVCEILSHIDRLNKRIEGLLSLLLMKHNISYIVIHC